MYDTESGNTLSAISAANHLPADLMLVKMEGEHILTMAAAKRRPIGEIIKEALSLLEANPLAAGMAVYSKPVGLKPDRCKKCGHQIQRKSWQKYNACCPNCRGDNQNMIAGKMNFARGLSIRAMESLRSVVGYNRVGCSVAKEDDGLYKITAIFTDYANGIISSDEDFVSQWSKDRSGKLYKQDEVRFMETTLKAAKSKTRRNVIRDSLPIELKQAYEQKAMELAPKLLDANKVTEIIDAFGEHGITLADLQHIVGRSRTDGWRKEEHETLRGVWVALENGEMTVEELLRECRPGPNDPVTEEELDGANGSQGGEQPQQGNRRRQKPASQPADQTAAVTSELTGEAPPHEPEAAKTEPAEQLPRRRTPAAEKPAWLTMKEEAIAADNTGDWDKAARKYRDAAGNHTSNDPDNPEVVSLLGLAKACEAKVNKTKQPAPPKQAEAASQSKAQAPVAPAAQSPAAAQRPAGGKAAWTPATCRSYLNSRWGEEMGNFDVDRLCQVAANQGNPQLYIDGILGRTNPYWDNFTVKADEGPVGEDSAELPFDGEAPPSEGEQRETTIDDLDRSNPIARPAAMREGAVHFEKQIKGYKVAARLQKLMTDHIEPADTLSNDEVAYLLFIGRQRLRELNGGQLPGMG